MPLKSSEHTSGMNPDLISAPKSFNMIIWTLIGVLFIIAFFNISDRLFNLSLIKSIGFQWEPMKLLTSLSFIITSFVVVIIRLNSNKIYIKILFFFLISVILIFSIISLYTNLYSFKTGHEPLVLHISFFRFFVSSDGTMSFLTSCCFFLTAIILVLLSGENAKAVGLAHFLIIPVLLISYFTIVCYILGVSEFSAFKHALVALNTAISFSALGIVFIHLRPRTWLINLYSVDSTGGIISRRLFIPASILPILIGWFHINGERGGMFVTEQGVVLVAIVYTFCLFVLVWLTARYINKIDLRRQMSEEILHENKEQLSAVFNGVSEMLMLVDIKGNIIAANNTANKSLGDSKSELTGKNIYDLIPAGFRDHRKEQISEIVRTKKPVKMKENLGETLLDLTLYPVFDANGNVVQYVSFAIDITERTRAEINLKESEDRFRTIAESLPVLIAIYSIRDSNFSFVNKSFENNFGLTNGAMLQRKLIDYFYNPDDRSDLGSVLSEKGKAYNKELKVKRADGTPFWILTSIRKISFKNDPAYLTASINITETKKWQDELIRLNRTMDAKSKSSQAMMHSKNEFTYLQEVCKIIIEDCGHSMVWVGYKQNDNRKAVKPVAYYGFDKGYIDQLNVTWDETERGRGPTGTSIRTGKPYLCKNMFTDPNFKPWRKAALERGYASSLTLPLVMEGKPFGSISIYSKEPDPFSESEISLLSDLAGDLVYGISFLRLEESERSAINLIKENDIKLKELIATKDKFFNIVAHDLKNPFTSLIGSSELLLENINYLNTKSIQDLALILHDSAKSGYAILQNLLDWSRSQTGLLKINPENINLRSLIKENISNLQLPADNKEIKMDNRLNEDLIVFTDKNMINTILRNLLGNALKFTRKSGKVIATACINNEEVIVSIKDDGIGIPEEKIESLFSLDLKNSMPGTENEPGTGLGLKLCKEFVEKLGGRIWVESQEDIGSEFKFTIPLNRVKEDRYIG